MKFEPFICITDTYEIPNLGIFEQFKVKYKELSIKELIHFGCIDSKDDLWERGLSKWFVIYSGKKPNLLKQKKIQYIEQDDFE